MEWVDVILNTVMTTASIVLFLYGLLRGYDTLELFIYNTYFIALILYLLKRNFLINL